MPRIAIVTDIVKFLCTEVERPTLVEELGERKRQVDPDNLGTSSPQLRMPSFRLDQLAAA